jgi:hypothetical protein
MSLRAKVEQLEQGRAGKGYCRHCKAALPAETIARCNRVEYVDNFDLKPLPPVEPVLCPTCGRDWPIPCNVRRIEVVDWTDEITEAIVAGAREYYRGAS